MTFDGAEQQFTNYNGTIHDDFSQERSLNAE